MSSKLQIQKTRLVHGYGLFRDTGESRSPTRSGGNDLPRHDFASGNSHGKDAHMQNSAGVNIAAAPSPPPNIRSSKASQATDDPIVSRANIREYVLFAQTRARKLKMQNAFINMEGECKEVRRLCTDRLPVLTNWKVVSPS